MRGWGAPCPTRRPWGAPGGLGCMRCRKGALELGLSPAQGRELALATFLGAAQLARQSHDDPATLRAKVTSKGGTTERAIQSLEQADVKALIQRAVRAAADRSRELGDELGKQS